ncbi:MAG: hypothetical protein ACXWRA_12725, partial [Pseudobdellovibrionaceae bacterium]
FLSIQSGANAAQSGDTIVVSAGTYGGFTTARSGAAGSPISFTRNGTDTVTITGQIVVNHNYITLNGFTTTFNDWYEGGSSIRVGYDSHLNHISVTKCHLIGNDPNTYLTVFYADDVLFDGNLMEGPKFYIGMVLGGQRHTISNNIFRNVVNVERIFNVAVSNSLWRGNEIYGLSWTGDQSVHPDIWQTINDGSIAQNNIIENNYIHDTGDTQVGNIETNSAGTNVSNWIFRNNLFANSGTLYNSGGAFKFYNNTYYRTGASNQATVLLYSGTGYGDASGAEFMNNIYIQDSNQGTFAVNMGNPTYTHDYNLVANTDFTPRSDFSEPHGVNGGNPQFTSVFSNCITNVCDFHIGSASAAKDKGTTIAGYSTDFAGNSRVAPWDIGVYEFGGVSAPTPTPLAAPTNLRIVSP